MDKIKFKYYIFDTSFHFRSEKDNYEDARVDLQFYKEMYPEKRFIMLKFVEEM